MGKRKDIEDADALIDQLLALCALHRKTIAKLEKENADLKALVKQKAYSIFSKAELEAKQH